MLLNLLFQRHPVTVAETGQAVYLLNQQNISYRLGAAYFRISLQQSADEGRLQPQRLFLCPDTAVIHQDLHRQSGIIRGLIPAGDLQRVTFQLYDRSVRAPRTK